MAHKYDSQSASAAHRRRMTERLRGEQKRQGPVSKRVCGAQKRVSERLRGALRLVSERLHGARKRRIERLYGAQEPIKERLRVAHGGEF